MKTMKTHQQTQSSKNVVCARISRFPCNKAILSLLRRQNEVVLIGSIFEFFPFFFPVDSNFAEFFQKSKQVIKREIERERERDFSHSKTCGQNLRKKNLLVLWNFTEREREFYKKRERITESKREERWVRERDEKEDEGEWREGRRIKSWRLWEDEECEGNGRECEEGKNSSSEFREESYANMITLCNKKYSAGQDWRTNIAVTAAFWEMLTPRKCYLKTMLRWILLISGKGRCMLIHFCS